MKVLVEKPKYVGLENREKKIETSRSLSDGQVLVMFVSKNWMWRPCTQKVSARTSFDREQYVPSKM